MRDVRTVVLDALERLRKGRGLVADDVDARVAPEFAVLFATPADHGEVLRRKLFDYLDGLMAGLPADREVIARVTLNVPPGRPDANLRRRMAFLAEEFRFDERTVRRRMDDAYRRMAERAARGPEAAADRGDGGRAWYVDVLDVVLRLDVPRPHALERRTVVATRSGLDVVDVPKADVEVVFGGRLTPDGLALPRTLEKGERHTYGLMRRVPPDRSRLVYVPHRLCRYFTLLVRFDPERLPGGVWRHDGVSRDVVRAGRPVGRELSLNGAHEVLVEFTGLVDGLAYGVHWSPDRSRD
ncbi:hypothetical protein GCM10022243_61760 [Saccharothrix violaceirubra]|uniref:Uncharacterized protein n=1 Tax=Saccharothrix violaceirubra TaxID=413306 RepID=A0A7W7T7R7_9PSEU|nr:hypothetical protein [Saccharothrix violaceirubra]MBB4968152.1 hypothetical protein [Saccharothrix violaceirubra]